MEEISFWKRERERKKEKKYVKFEVLKHYGKYWLGFVDILEERC
jgi:hypothetical protein